MTRNLSCIDVGKDLARIDREHVLHPWGRLHPDGTTSFVLSGDGVSIQDGHGKTFLDGVAGLWCVNIGYGRAEMASAIAAQAMRLPFYSAFMELGNEPATLLSAALATAAPGDLGRVFFTTGGSTANDSAIRFLHLLANRSGQPQRKHLITRADAYHGSTYLAASCSGKFSDRQDLDVIEDEVHHLSSVNPYRRPDNMSIEEFCAARVAELEQKILDLGPDRVLGFIAEPILASGGVIVPPPGYQAKSLAVCRRYGVKYISDEVVTGFGRLGHLFASEAAFGIVPDIITCAKGLTSGYVPLGAAIFSQSLCEETDQDGAAVFSNGFTYAGHPVACAAALENLAIMAREEICAHVRELGPYFQRRLRELDSLGLVGDVRGMGLLAGIEFTSDRARRTSFPADLRIGKRVADACLARGVIVRPLGNAVGISPPLIVTQAHVDRLVDALSGAIQAVMDALAREGVRIAG